jgi:hypothetical protein
MNRPLARTWAALAASLVVLTFAVGATLLRSPPTLAGSNGVQTALEFETVTGRFEGCQGNEVLPRHTTAVRLSLDSVLGPRIQVKVLVGKRVVTSGYRDAGWTAADVTIPLRPLARAISGAKLCFRFHAIDEGVGLVGQRTSGPVRPGTVAGVVKVEYLRPGGDSWWSLASSVAGNMSFGHAWSGGWIVPFLAVAMGAVLGIVAWMALRLAR